MYLKRTFNFMCLKCAADFFEGDSKNINYKILKMYDFYT